MPHKMETPLLILDLDETLLFGEEQPLSRSCDFNVGPYHIYLRPHLAEFLATVSGWFKLAVWTSSSSGYAGPVVERLFRPPLHLEFMWSCSRCVNRYDPETLSYYFVKDLRKVKRLGFPLERILVIDDSPEKLERNYGNHIRVKPFLGDESDTELKDLAAYLDSVRSADNFRRIEKRGWNNPKRTSNV